VRIERAHQWLILQKTQIAVVGEKIVTRVDAVLAVDLVHRLLNALQKGSGFRGSEKYRVQMVCHIRFPSLS
jgi:hypothetical protein